MSFFATRQNHRTPRKRQDRAAARFTTFRCESLEARMMLSLVPQLMQESNGGPVGVEVHSPIVAVGNVVYFVESDSLSSRDTLWRSDGTPAGTQPVRYVEGGTSRIDIHGLFNGNGRLFFTTNDGVH